MCGGLDVHDEVHRLQGNVAPNVVHFEVLLGVVTAQVAHSSVIGVLAV